MNKFLKSLLIISIFLVACQKEEDQDLISGPGDQAYESTIQDNEKLIYDSTFNEYVPKSYSDFVLNNEKVSQSQFFEDLKAEFNHSKSNNIKKSSPSVWGVGSGSTVWKWNGSYWFQPNSAARLSIVCLSKSTDGSVWGVGTNRTVWKWNGRHWFQPNPAARVYTLSVFSDDLAVGIGAQGALVVTHNGGANWSTISNTSKYYRVSLGSQVTNPLWGVRNVNSRTYLMQGTINNTFIQRNVPVRPIEVAALHTNGTYFTENRNGAKRVYIFDGVNTYQPNSAARLYKSPSCSGNDLIWAIGSNNIPVKSTNGGYNWTTPNPAARLFNISVGYE